MTVQKFIIYFLLTQLAALGVCAGAFASQTAPYPAYRGALLELPGGAEGFPTKVVTATAPNPAVDSGDPGRVLGPPDTITDNDPGSYSLGCKGEIVLHFGELPVAEGDGPDLYLVEVGEAAETVDLFVSVNGDDWIGAGISIGGVEGIDISPFVSPGETFEYLKLRDRGDKCYGTRAGADIDAVSVLPRKRLVPPSEEAPAYLYPVKTGNAPQPTNTVTLDGAVLFEAGNFRLSHAGEENLLELAMTLRSNNGPVTVVGHTDSTGSEESNLALSRKRAEAVANFLLESTGMDTGAILTEGMGENHPVADNKTKEGRAKNRRVEIVFGKLGR